MSFIGELCAVYLIYSVIEWIIDGSDRVRELESRIEDMEG